MKLLFGYWWPDNQYQGSNVVIRRAADLPRILKYVKSFDCAVQAGGNVGIFAKELAKHFKEIHTLEPDRENFECIEMNVKEPNVIKYNKALSNTYELISVKAPKGMENNCTSYEITQGNIEAIPLDDLNLSPDFISLSLNGYEPFALEGAIKTIKRNHPAIAFEDRGMFGTKKGACLDFLKEHGYKKLLDLRYTTLCGI